MEINNGLIICFGTITHSKSVGGDSSTSVTQTLPVALFSTIYNASVTSWNSIFIDTINSCSISEIRITRLNNNDKSSATATKTNYIIIGT